MLEQVFAIDLGASRLLARVSWTVEPRTSASTNLTSTRSMYIKDCFKDDRPVFSFEFFPPKTPEALEGLYTTIEKLAPLNPSFVSVTYGAGGSTRERTIDLVGRIKNQLNIEAAAHLTCVGHSAAEIGAILERLKAQGIENIIALRGDPPKGETQYVQAAGGFAHGSDLVRFIRFEFDFCIGSGCYPEGHVECADMEADLRHLKIKVDAGLDFLVTQLFFDSEDYFRFVDRARKIGIDLPIVPGLMPVSNIGQLEKYKTMCGASIPAAMRQRLEAVQDDPDAVTEVGIEWASEQCQALLGGGAPGIHFYTLNRSRSTRRIFENLRGAAVGG